MRVRTHLFARTSPACPPTPSQSRLELFPGAFSVLAAPCLSALCLAALCLLALPDAGRAQEAPSQIEGRVLIAPEADAASDEAVPLPGAQVRLEPALVGAVRTDGDGAFVFRRLPPRTYTIIASAPGFRDQRQTVNLGEEPVAALEFALPLLPTTLDSIDVTASYSLGRDDPARAAALSAEELLELPHFGDDIVRAIAVLPGVASGDASAEFNVRGGLTREVRYEIDGLEIFEPYHLQDFQGIFSIIDPDVLSGVDFYTGSFPVEYGDRSTAVLDLSTYSPEERRFDFGISLLSAWGSAAGQLEKGSWFASARRGWLDLVLDLVGDEDSEQETSEGSGPEYWDFLAKYERDFSERQTFRFNALLSGDTNDQFEREIEGDEFEEETTDASYGNSYVWLRHESLLGDRGLLESMASVGRVDRDRFVEEIGTENDFRIREERQLDVLQARQDLSLDLGKRHFLKAGWEGRRYEADYDYSNDVALISPVGEVLGRAPVTTFEGLFDSTHLGLYVADRWQVGNRLVVEAGARWDRFSLTDEDHVSPRLNAVLDLGGGWRGRLGWGQFYQSQRPHELQVGDGETRFFEAERAEHRTLGLERNFARGRANWVVRADLYQRQMDDLRPRYENLFQTFVLNPETANDRILVEPTEALASGLELFVARRAGGKFDWWVNYAWSEVEDTIDGVDVLRATDQTHALNLSLNWRPGARWNFNAVWGYHTGWPTTPVGVTLAEGPDGPRALPVIGALRSERLDDYHRLDLRASRRFQLDRGLIELFIDVQNLYNRENEAGFEVDGANFSIDEAGLPVYTPTPETWLGIIPSFGISWSF